MVLKLIAKISKQRNSIARGTEISMFEHTIFSKNIETRERAERIQLRPNARDDSFRNSLRWPMHIINPVGKTKLSYSNIVHYSLITWRVKQTTPRKRPPPTERPYQRHRKVGKSVPEKVFFCVFGAQLQQNTRSSQ